MEDKLLIRLYILLPTLMIIAAGIGVVGALIASGSQSKPTDVITTKVEQCQMDGATKCEAVWVYENGEPVQFYVRLEEK